ncbi:DUF742 domain-containing protein [Streptomyces sp. TP-A0874]|uniref:DUF742 domain-containing protein n=1 Tax=Streptomyces sp. TP-A0874 TaxID=549819 RepID=UPI0008536FE1|nr:DUF742 domain-containing protein [Streptomyces sp. TP-A0874]
MSTPEESEWDEGRPDRFYVITGGRSGTGEEPLDLTTLICAESPPDSRMQPERAAIVRLCSSPLSVVEISSYLHLPVSVITALLATLLEEGHVSARSSIPAALLPDRELIQAVIHGLEQL